MTPWRPGSSASVLLLAALLLVPALAEDDTRLLVVPAGAAPTVDGDLGAEEWTGARVFEVKRGEDGFGTGRLLRSGRHLYVHFEGRFQPAAMGLRVTFIDRVSQLRHFLMIAPLDPPQAPLVVLRQPKDRAPERADAATCDIRFSLKPDRPFTFEARVPLDLLEFGRRAEEYGFTFEIWDQVQQKPVAIFPGGRSLLSGPRTARLRPASDWGADARPSGEPARQPALDLLGTIGRERQQGGDEPATFLGWADGRKKTAPLEALEGSLAKLSEAYPDYVTLRTERISVLAALGRHDDAVTVLDGIERDYPVLALTPRHHLARAEMLRSAGRFEEAHKYLAARRATLPDDAAVERELRILAYLREAARNEKAMREQAGDLPRVRIATPRGPIVIELFEDDAPNAVANFVSLAERGFYDGTRFHWVEGGRRAIGGDPNSRDEDVHNDGFGHPGYLIESEPGRRSHLPFSVSLLDERRTPRTEGCVFAIQLTPYPGLDGRHTVIGRVVEGFDVVRRLDYYDRIDQARVVSKRPHPYEPIKRNR